MSKASNGAAATGDTNYGDSNTMHTKFTVWNAGPTPYDRGDDTLVSGCTLTTQGPNVFYDKKWKELCHFTPTVGQRYYLNVRSTSPDNPDTWGPKGNNYNGYALRVVAGTYPAACIQDSFPQLNSTSCYGVDPQPRLSGYTDMEMYNGIPVNVPTQFFIANVKNEYAGKTLVIELWDPGDGAGDSNITVMKPGTTTGGVAQVGCAYQSTTPSGAVDQSGTKVGACTIVTTSGGTNAFQNEWLQIKINLPSDYTCNESANPTTTGGSCWWQIKYLVSSGGALSDYTTWTARIEGDPVRLIE